jgi:hypothetical protein
MRKPLDKSSAAQSLDGRTVYRGVCIPDAQSYAKIPAFGKQPT